MYKERQGREGYKNAVGECISKEKNEKFVVWKSYAVVNPRAMVIHFSDTDSTDATVVASVWFDMCTFIAVPHWKSVK